jgi:hypothetical protein
VSVVKIIQILDKISLKIFSNLLWDTLVCEGGSYPALRNVYFGSNVLN